MSALVAHTRWMTGIAAGLATATVTLPPIATTSLASKPLGVTAFVLLGLSAWCGTVAARLYVAYILGTDDVMTVLGIDENAANFRVARALSGGGRWALRQQLLFAVGSILAGVFLIINL